MENLFGLIISFIYIGLIIISARLFKKAGEEASRKYIHIMLSNWWFIAMLFFTNTFWAAFGPLCFIVINYASYKGHLISVMEREKQDGLGTVYYAISLFLMVIYTFQIIKRPEIGLCATLIMGYGDGLASLVGQTVKSYEFKVGNTKKTIAGCLTMFTISFILLAVYMFNLATPLWILKSLGLALILTVVEALSIKGTDNITVPIIACLLLTLV